MDAEPPGSKLDFQLTISAVRCLYWKVRCQTRDRDSSVTVGTRPGKRERLVHAASELVHHQGVEKTTLAEIAEAADVPLGNVYYYFKTKDALIDAVVDAQVQGIEATIASLARHRTPKGRLKALIRVLADQGDVIASYGCPHGTLCSELEKQQDDHAGHAAHGDTPCLDRRSSSDRWVDETPGSWPSSS